MVFDLGSCSLCWLSNLTGEERFFLFFLLQPFPSFTALAGAVGRSALSGDPPPLSHKGWTRGQFTHRALLLER